MTLFKEGYNIANIFKGIESLRFCVGTNLRLKTVKSDIKKVKIKKLSKEGDVRLCDYIDGECHLCGKRIKRIK